MPTTLATMLRPETESVEHSGGEGYLAVLTAIREALWDLPPGGAEPTGRQASTAMSLLIELRSILDHHAAVGAATLDRLGVARQSTGKTSALLITMGAAPAIAHRCFGSATHTHGSLGCPVTLPTARSPGNTPMPS